MPPSGQFASLNPAGMRREEFAAAFGGIFEGAPWVAEAVWEDGVGEGDNDVLRMHRRMCEIVYAADATRRHALVCGHPELSARMRRRDNIAADSLREQKGAGLDGLDEDESKMLAKLNRGYRGKFGFPFILAVGGLGKEEIFAALHDRIKNDAQSERENALREICGIALLRLRRL
ncbi:MAG: 2-oxo-4-hydroxy-4-carboxy-5-ureidoimidazoline decarboxylase [Gammaproteobacteria bacterium]